MADPWAAAGFQDIASPPPSSSSSQGDPWAAAGFTDASQAGASSTKTPSPSVWEAIKERFNNPPNEPSLIGMAGQAYRLASGLGSGTIDPSTPEGALSGADAALTFSPASAGEKLFGTAGREVARTLSPGERAAQTAADLGAPLPRGVTSNSPMVQATTAKLQELPLAGERIKSAVGDFQEAAGSRIGEIASEMGGGDRASAAATVQPSLKSVIDSNNDKIDGLYSMLRGVINPDQVSSLPRTQAVYNDIIRQRTAAKQANPTEGLSDTASLLRRPQAPDYGPTVLRGVEALNDVPEAGAWGASFNGLQRARSDIGNSLNFGTANPGFNKGDLKRLYGAMSGDMEDVVRQNVRPGIDPDQASTFLRSANAGASTLIERNKTLQRLVNTSGESSLGTLLNASREKGGNLDLLRQLRGSMDPEEFSPIGGTLLGELGRNNATGEFSLPQFVTNWNKVSDGAKRTLFAPDHLANIEDIAQAGTHAKKALAAQTRGQSGSLLVMLDVAKDAALLGGDIASGGLGLGSAIGAGSTAGLYGLTRWLASPAKSASMAAWSRARYAYTSAPTTARQATLNIATRNLATNLGVPVASIVKNMPEFAAGGPVPSQARGNPNNQSRAVSGPAPQSP